jgi:hypothetical protein
MKQSLLLQTCGIYVKLGKFELFFVSSIPHGIFLDVFMIKDGKKLTFEKKKLAYYKAKVILKIGSRWFWMNT